MSVLRTILSGYTDAMAPDGTMVRLRLRSVLELLLTIGIAVLAIVLAVGYPIVGRWARRSGWVD